MKKKPNNGEKKYNEGRKAKQEFERAMTALFRVPKVTKSKSQKGGWPILRALRNFWVAHPFCNFCRKGGTASRALRPCRRAAFR